MEGAYVITKEIGTSKGIVSVESHIEEAISTIEQVVYNIFSTEPFNSEPCAADIIENPDKWRRNLIKKSFLSHENFGIDFATSNGLLISVWAVYTTPYCNPSKIEFSYIDGNEICEDYSSF